MKILDITYAMSQMQHITFQKLSARSGVPGAPNGRLAFLHPGHPTLVAALIVYRRSTAWPADPICTTLFIGQADHVVTILQQRKARDFVMLKPDAAELWHSTEPLTVDVHGLAAGDEVDVQIGCYVGEFIPEPVRTALTAPPEPTPAARRRWWAFWR
jgi:hypothetical protein